MSNDDLASQFADDLAEAVEAGEFDEQLDEFMGGTVVDTWRENSPEDSGTYKDSVKVIDAAQAGKGRVGTSLGYANLVEYGTADTPEFAPRQKTVEQLNKTDVAI